MRILIILKKRAFRCSDCAIDGNPRVEIEGNRSEKGHWPRGQNHKVHRGRQKGEESKEKLI